MATITVGDVFHHVKPGSYSVVVTLDGGPGSIPVVSPKSPFRVPPQTPGTVPDTEPTTADMPTVSVS